MPVVKCDGWNGSKTKMTSAETASMLRMSATMRASTDSAPRNCGGKRPPSALWLATLLHRLMDVNPPLAAEYDVKGGSLAAAEQADPRHAGRRPPQRALGTGEADRRR